MLLSRGPKVKSEPYQLYALMAIAQIDLTSTTPSCYDVSVFLFIVPLAPTKAHLQNRRTPSIAIHGVLSS
jgi:hypothetical protein